MLFISFSSAANAQRIFARRLVKQNHGVLRHRIFIHKHRLKKRNQRQDGIKHEIIQSDTLQFKSGR
jgi:hypothetical protein